VRLLQNTAALLTAAPCRLCAGDYYIVVGAALERFVQMTNWEFFESVQRFSFVMKKVGVWGALKAAGVEEGDPVVIGTMEMAWEEEDDEGQLFDNWRRSGLGGPTRGGRHWPHGG
jgi:GTP-binding protein